VYSAPADLKFVDAMQKVALRVHLGLYHDETGAQCHWHIPETHFLEMWSDVRGHDGTVSIVQPLIAPLYGGRSVHEVMSALSQGGIRSGYDIVRSFWISSATGDTTTTPQPNTSGAAVTSSFDQGWRKWLHDGVVPNTAFPTKTVTVQAALPAATAAAGSSGELDVVFRPDPSVYDGRFANNAWLQELPKSLTKLTWDNAALIAPQTADRLMLVSGDVVDSSREARLSRFPCGWLLDRPRTR
jgi:molybdopterin-containing oxidoreductase family iron-sulfur binding subunit